MAKKLISKEIESLRNFTELIESNLSDNKTMWFRGSGKSKYKLSPSLFRHPDLKEDKEFLELEVKLIQKFKQKSIPYLERQLIDDWDYLFFMQHFGIPTRLLDWTENPYIALYFALTSAHKKVNSIGFSSDAAIWMLNPIDWNKTVIKYIDYSGEILSVYDKYLNSYAPYTEIHLINEKPIAINGTYNSTRIVAQKGVFMLFGKSLYPLEVLFEKVNFPNDTLEKIIIKKENIANLLNSLITIGFSDSVIFPELEGLSKEIKREFNFEV